MQEKQCETDVLAMVRTFQYVDAGGAIGDQRLGDGAYLSVRNNLDRDPELSRHPKETSRCVRRVITSKRED